MGQPLPADLTHPGRSSRWESVRRVCPEEPGDHQTGAVDPEQADAHADRRPGPAARRTPTAAATVIAPVITKVAIWIQPHSPFASWLAACRVGSNPSRVAICPATASTYIGPAMTP